MCRCYDKWQWYGSGGGHRDGGDNDVYNGIGLMMTNHWY